MQDSDKDINSSDELETVMDNVASVSQPELEKTPRFSFSPTEDKFVSINPKKKFLNKKPFVIISIIILFLISIPLITIYKTHKTNLLTINNSLEEKNYRGLLDMYNSPENSEFYKKVIATKLKEVRDIDSLKKILDLNHDLPPDICNSLMLSMVALKDPQGQEYLEYRFISSYEAKNEKFIKSIGEAFISQSVKFMNIQGLYGLYTTGPSSLAEDSKQLLINSGKIDDIKKLIITDINANKYSSSVIFTIAKNLIPNNIDEVKTTIGLSEQNTIRLLGKDFDKAHNALRELKDLGISSSANIDNAIQAITDYNSLNSEINKLNSQIQVIDSKISEVTLQRDSIDAQIRNYDAFSLTAYMIGKLGNDFDYEIALPSYDYYGRYPSANHALFITTDTIFSSTGWFTVTVRDIGEQDVNLLNGFSSKWPAYREVSKSEQDQFEKQKSTTYQLSDQLGSLDNQRSSLEGSIPSIKQKIANKSDSVTKMLENFSL